MKKSPENIVTQLKKYTDNKYVLIFHRKKSINLFQTKIVGHAVIPYRVETTENSDKIYIWDNNRPYLKDKPEQAYNQYIEIYTDSNGELKWKNGLYTRTEFKSLGLINIANIYNNGIKTNPKGYGENDKNIILNGTSDLTLVDSQGRISGFQNGQIFEQIPGVEVIIPMNDTPDSNDENTWKEIYLPENQEGLTIKVSGDITESYDLTIVGGNVYTKISSVETTDGQIDTFNISKDNIKIDFDDNKTGEYTILMHNFYNNGTGHISEKDMQSNIKPQQYNIDWTKIYNNAINSMTYEIDTDLDGIYEDYTSSLPTYFSPTVLMTSPSIDIENSSEKEDNKEEK